MATYEIKPHHPITNIGQVYILNSIKDIILLANNKKNVADGIISIKKYQHPIRILFVLTVHNLLYYIFCT